MRWFDRCSLPALALMTAIVSTPGSSQSPTVHPDNATPAPASQVTTTTITSIKAPPSAEQLGDMLMAHQRYQAAIEAYKKAPQNDAAAWNKMGIAYQLMFNLTEAMHCYRTSDKLSPRNSNVLNNLGTVYDALKQYHNAEKMYRKALKIDPTSALDPVRTWEQTCWRSTSTRRVGKSTKPRSKSIRRSSNDNSRPRIENPASMCDRGAMNYYLAKGCSGRACPNAPFSTCACH